MSYVFEEREDGIYFVFTLPEHVQGKEMLTFSEPDPWRMAALPKGN